MHSAATRPSSPITAAEIQLQLDRILTSKGFRGSPRLQRFLKLAVERTLAGETDQLKEYSVGRDVFDRGPEYDPRMDSIVRVEARRLRRKLREYYATAPDDSTAEPDVEPVIIGFPRGSYVAEFSRRVPESADAPGEAKTLAPPDPCTIAVLPFTNLSNDPEQQYFCDGITEDIINALTPMSQLQVIGQTSMFALDPGMRDAREIGERLGAGTIIEGTVRKAGEVLRISAKIIDSESRQTKWSQVFDRPVQDLFAIEDEIAQSIAAVLRVTLETDQVREVLRPAPNSEAHTLYLKGRQAWNLMTRAGYLMAIDFFQDAIRLSPDCPPPFAGFAYAHIWLSMWGGIRPSEAYPKCKEAALHSLKLDPSLAAGYGSLGASVYFFERKYQEGIDLLKKATELNPSYAFAHELYGRMLMTVGRTTDALPSLQHAVHLDPLSFRTNRTLATGYSLAGRLLEAEQWGKTALALRPEAAETHYLMARIYLQTGELDKALTHARECDREDISTVIVAILGVVLARRGEVDEARRVLDRISKFPGYVDPMASAYIESALGDQKAALEHVRQSRKDRSPFATHVNVDPIFSALHADPEFHVE